MKLSQLFSLCVGIPYEKIGISSNYAFKRVGTTLYLFFESSKGGNDWKSNLDFPAKPYKRMGRTVWFAHRGFLKAWKEIEPMLAEVVSDKEIKKIVITGYSHGAAIAALCHEYVWFHRPDIRGVLDGYGFGCPRVFWGIKSKTLKKRMERFTVVRNIDDIVTHLPPSWLGYFHAGALLKIGARGKYSRVDAHKADTILIELLAYEKR